MIADEPARRRMEDQAHAAAARGAHFDQFGFADRELLHDDAGMRLVDIDDDLFDRFPQLAVGRALEQHLRARYR